MTAATYVVRRLRTYHILLEIIVGYVTNVKCRLEGEESTEQVLERTFILRAP